MHFSQLERITRKLFFQAGSLNTDTHRASYYHRSLAISWPYNRKITSKTVKNEDFFARSRLVPFSEASITTKNSVFRLFPRLIFRLFISTGHQEKNWSQRHFPEFSTPSCDNFSLVTCFFISTKVFFRITNVCLCLSCDAPHKAPAPRSQRERN